MYIKTVILLFILMIFTGNTFAATCSIEAKAFIGYLDIDIEGCEIDGKLTRSSDGKYFGTFSADLSKLDTGVEKRTKHMREKYLQVAEYPVIIVKLLPVSIGQDKFKAEVSLHGVTKQISGDLRFNSESDFKATFDIDITQFGMEKPGYADIVIGQNIGVTVTL